MYSFLGWETNEAGLVDHPGKACLSDLDGWILGGRIIDVEDGTQHACKLAAFPIDWSADYGYGFS